MHPIYFLFISGFPGFLTGIVSGEILGMYYGWKEGGFPVITIIIFAGGVSGLFMIPILESFLVGGAFTGAVITALVAYIYEHFSVGELGSEYILIVIFGASSAVGVFFLLSLIPTFNLSFPASYVGFFIGSLTGIIGGTITRNRAKKERWTYPWLKNVSPRSIISIAGITLIGFWVLFFSGFLPGEETEGFCLLSIITVLVVILLINFGKGAVSQSDEHDDSPDRFGESF